MYTEVLAFDDGVKLDGPSLAWTESKCFWRASGLLQLAMHIGQTNPCIKQIHSNNTNAITASTTRTRVI